MYGRYEVEDLLKLRASPLVVKPPGLPPKEEWMGPTDPRPRTATTRPKLDDAFNQTEGFQKRPTLLDSTRRSTTDPERIHLGPPRHSFASSNTARGRNGTHERSKTNEDSDRKSGAYAGTNGKFESLHTDELEGAERPRRRNDDGDMDLRPRRDFDRPRWGNRDNLLEEEDSLQRNGRESYPKRKYESPWSRKEKQSDLEDSGRVDSPAWRRGNRERDNDRIDAEPEWVDAEVAQEPAKAHTHEDFLQWMEKMKNKNTGDDKPAQLDPTQKEVATALGERPQPRVVSDTTASADKFFAKFEEKKAGEAAQPGSKPSKSRFASIFGAKDEVKQEPSLPFNSVTSPAPPAPPAELEQPTPSAEPEKKVHTDAAFARLLEMLNKNQSTSPSPALMVQNTRNPVDVAELASVKSPELGNAVSAHGQSGSQAAVPVHTPNLSLDRLLESRSPAHHVRREQPGPTKAGPQDLLDLLRRSEISDKQPPQQHQASLERGVSLHPPGLPPVPIHDQERQPPPLISTRRDNPRSIFDDPAFAGYRNEQEYQQRNTQSPDHGALGGLFAAMNNRSFDVNQQDQRPFPPPAGNAPPGLRRPPGFDTGPRPPPGWVPPVQQRQPPYQPQNINAQHLPFQQAPYPQQQQPAPRQMPARKPTADLPLPPVYPNIPPGFGPAPTYASPTSPDIAMQYAARGGYAIDERQRVDRERQQQQNAFAAMYGNSNRGGTGGVQLPPGFR